MRTVHFLMAALVTMVPTAAQADCVPSMSRTCYAGRSFDFTIAGLQQPTIPQTPAVPSPQAKTPPQVAIAPGFPTSPAFPPIDCGMVKADSRTIDPGIARNTRLPSSTRFPMNVVRVPSCQPPIASERPTR